MEYNVIWIDDECKSRMGALFIQRCEKYGVHIEPFEYGIDGLNAFEEDLNHWHAIIFDAKMLYRPGTPDTAHLYEARDRLNSLNLKKYIPSYILTAQPGLMSSENFAKSVRCKVFNKLDLKAQEKLIENIRADVNKSHRHQLDYFYHDSLECLKSFSDDAYNIILDVLEAMHYPGYNTGFKPILHYNQLRQVLEILFRAANDVSLIPDECFPKDKKEVNINQCFMYLIGSPAKKARVRYGKPGERIAPKHIQDMISMILNLGNENSHSGLAKLNDDELRKVEQYFNKNVGNSKYIVYSFALQICEIAMWMKKCISVSDKERNRSKCKKLEVGVVESIENNKTKCHIGNSHCIDTKYIERNNLLGKKVIIIEEKDNSDNDTKTAYPLYALKIEAID